MATIEAVKNKTAPPLQFSILSEAASRTKLYDELEENETDIYLTSQNMQEGENDV